MNTINNVLLKASNISFFAIALLLSCDTAHAWRQYVPTEEESEMTIMPVGDNDRMQQNVRLDETDTRPIYLDPVEPVEEDIVMTTMQDVY